LIKQDNKSISYRRTVSTKSWGRPDCVFNFYVFAIGCSHLSHPKLKVFLGSSVNKSLSRFCLDFFFQFCCRCKFFTLPRGSLSLCGVFASFNILAFEHDLAVPRLKFCTPERPKNLTLGRAYECWVVPEFFGTSFRNCDQVYFP
jgi:hypothetical protein